jgi:DNA polymerase I-like protein with 3'-5' exonuclease and polymerase domains
MAHDLKLGKSRSVMIEKNISASLFHIEKMHHKFTLQTTNRTSHGKSSNPSLNNTPSRTRTHTGGTGI